LEGRSHNSQLSHRQSGGWKTAKLGQVLNRRSFFASLAGGAAALTLDPDKLLWVPGKKLISIPAPRPFLAIGDIVTFGVGDIVTFSKWSQCLIVTSSAESLERMWARRHLFPHAIQE
jgi:hypothetical protein